MTKSVPDSLKPLNNLKNILLEAINDPQVKIYLFGSWARSTPKNSSDIDIGIWHPAFPGAEFFMHLRDLVEESTIPYRVDIVDLNHADPVIIDKVQTEGILWSGY